VEARGGEGREGREKVVDESAILRPRIHDSRRSGMRIDGLAAY
jgi:hypothetical protein